MYVCMGMFLCVCVCVCVCTCVCVFGCLCLCLDFYRVSLWVRAFLCGCVCDCLGDRDCGWVSVICVCDSRDSEYPRKLLYENAASSLTTYYTLDVTRSPPHRITLYHYWTRHITMHVIVGKPVKPLSRHGRGMRGWSVFRYWSSEGVLDVF